jgi:uncharacterized membrane protein HdeD (DUF308 family)
LTQTSLAPSPLTLERGFVVASAITAIVLGVVALIWPGVTLLTVALLFGAHLVITGIFRLVLAFTGETLSTGLRWLIGILGALIVAAGIFALANPLQSLVILVFVIGIGWILDGIAAIVGGMMGRTAVPRWLAIASGAVSIIGGVVVLAQPGLAIGVFVILGAWILIAIGVATLFSLPPKKSAAAAA